MYFVVSKIYTFIQASGKSTLAQRRLTEVTTAYFNHWRSSEYISVQVDTTDVPSTIND